MATQKSPPDYEDAIKAPSEGPQTTQYWDPSRNPTSYGGSFVCCKPTVVQDENQQGGNTQPQPYFVPAHTDNPNYGNGVYPDMVGPINGNYDSEMGETMVKPDQMLFDDKTIRAGFIRKVFGILMIQLLVVLGLISLFVFHDGTRHFVQSHSWLYWLSYVTFFVTYMMLVCVRTVRRKFPGNVIALGFLTLSLGYMAAMISSYHKTKIVFLAMGICAACCFMVILFACQTKYDFTKCTGVLFVITMVMFFFGITAVFVAIYARSNIMYLVYAGIMALVFMVWLAIDVQMVIGGGKKYEISPEDYVMAATELFLDILYIFIFILQLLGGSD